MKKALIYFPERQLSPKGGPAGYLYNLRNGLTKALHEDLEISFYSNSPVGLEENQSLRSRIPKRIKEIRRAYKFSHYLKRSLPIDMSLFSFDAIHFHKTEDMFLNRELLKEYKGKVILTSHTPCAPYKEIIGRLNPKDYRFYKKKIDALVEMDRYAFERADYIIFPCEEAEEPYFHTWNSYSLIRKPDKYHYMPTGIVGCKATVNREEYRRKLGIPNDAFVVSYAGRHNEIKGYGELKKIGEKLLLNDNVWFLIAGREGPLYKLNNSKWIEIGWTTDPHSMIAASDIFVLPNKETYFDLILLEVLSLGVPVTISATGGNKYFNKFGVPGIKMYHTIDEACEIITKFKDQNYDARIAIGNSNLELFRSEFTVDKFAENYVHILNDILK